ncbi:MAG: archaeosortase/exosortase family protein [Betaproteobacteria bacterium]
MTQEFEILYQLVFLGTAVPLVLLERVHALQRQRVQIARRWTSNIGLFIIGSVVDTLVLPIGIYAFAQHLAPGLLSRMGLPFAVELLLTFLVLDLWRYWEHRLFHRIPWLWRVHLVHHSDTQIDVTTSERHHPLEFILGTAVMMGLIAALGLPAAAVGVYLLAATVVALYSHANLRLDPSLDRLLRRLVVTPSQHAVHHSDLQAETDSNYGSVLTVWDRLFGTYVDPRDARIPRFGLDYFRRPGDARLLCVLQQPFRFRQGIVDRVGIEATPPTKVTEPPRAAMTPRCKEALLGGIAGAVLVCVAMWPTLLEMTASWRTHESYQYAWLVPPMVVYLLRWHHRSTGLLIRPQPDLTGIWVVIIAAACWGAASLTNIDVGRQLAFVLALQGVAMSTLGWRSYWKLFPTFGLLFLMVPSGDLLEPALRLLTARSIELFAVVAHLPHSVEGFVIFIGANRYIVVDECSGLAFVTLGAFLGYSFGCLLYRSFFKVAILALFGALLGIVSNVVRVNAIVLIDWIRGSQMELTAHGTIQWIALFATLGLLFYLLSRLKGDAERGTTTIDPVEQTHAIRRFGPVLAGLSMLLIGGSAAALPANELRSSRGAHAIALAQNISGWELVKPADRWTVDPTSRTESISLTYRRHGRDIKLPESRLAPHDRSVWRQKQVQREAACGVSRCIRFLHSTWQRDKGQQLRHVYYAYSIGSFTTEAKLAFRVAQGWQRLIGGRDHPRLIGFISDDVGLDVGELGPAFDTLRLAVD